MKRRTPEHREKIRQIMLQKWSDKKYRDQQLQARFGKSGYWPGNEKPVEHKRKISQDVERLVEESGSSNLGRTVSRETRDKISRSLKGNVPWNKGKKTGPHSEESNRKRSKSSSKALTGKKHTPEHIENTRKARTGLKLSFETCVRMSLSKFGNQNAYKGGRFCRGYPPEWDRKTRKSIRERDGYICQNCKTTKDKNLVGDKLYDMNVHHIDYEKDNCTEFNLITVCHSCNSKANGNRDEWTRFYQDKIVKIYCQDLTKRLDEMKLKLNIVDRIVRGG